MLIVSLCLDVIRLSSLDYKRSGSNYSSCLHKSSRNVRRNACQWSWLCSSFKNGQPPGLIEVPNRSSTTAKLRDHQPYEHWAKFEILKDQDFSIKPRPAMDTEPQKLAGGRCQAEVSNSLVANLKDLEEPAFFLVE